MFVLLILFFIVYLFSVVFFYYKLKVQDDEIESLYDNLYEHIGQDFRIVGDKNA